MFLCRRGKLPQRLPCALARRGNCKIASRLLHEKHLAAASRHGNQRDETCSFGASLYGQPVWHPQPEHVFHVVRRPRRIAMPPLRENFVHIAQPPIDDAAELRGVDARFLAHLTSRRLDQRLSWLLASGYGLPMIGKVGTFEKQCPQIAIMDDDQAVETGTL